VSEQTKGRVDKNIAFAHMLRSESSFYIHINPSKPGVVLPDHLPKDKTVALQLGNGLPVPMRDLHIDGSGVSVTLSFNRTPFRVFAPWASVCVVVNEKGLGFQWPDDMLPALADAVKDEKRKTLPKGWKVIDGGKS
jgi:hypothetical protein